MERTDPVPKSAAARPAIPAARIAMAKAFESLPREHGFEALAIEGEIPRELRGTLYKNGPSVFEAQGTPYRHWLDGDGAITAVRFAEGRAEGAVRVTLTPHLAEERQAGRMLYGSGFTPGPIWHKRLFGGGKNAMNIHVLTWQGRLFAMTEMAAPIELDPATLQTKGPWNLGGVLRQGLNAHVRIHPTTGAIYAMGSTIGMRHSLDVYELPAAGAPRLLTAIPMPAAPLMVHDFALSERHLIFVRPPVRLRMMPVMLGTGTPMDAISMHPEDGSEIIVVPIDRPTDVVRFMVPTFFKFHDANAFEDGEGRLCLDVCRYPKFDLGEAFMLDRLRSGDAWLDTPVATLDRAFLDLGKKTLRFERIWEANCDFPSTAHTHQGRRARHLFALVNREMIDRVTHVDLETGETRESDLGELQVPGEPTFVPRPGARDEDDGWLLTVVFDGRDATSYVAVLDARDPSRLIAKARFDHHVAFPLHGAFAPG
jgi:all-trans-8'-apo-beta-carotenal 15,15'-oxygenase